MIVKFFVKVGLQDPLLLLVLSLESLRDFSRDKVVDLDCSFVPDCNETVTERDKDSSLLSVSDWLPVRVAVFQFDSDVDPEDEEERCSDGVAVTEIFPIETVLELVSVKFMVATSLNVPTDLEGESDEVLVKGLVIVGPAVGVTTCDGDSDEVVDVEVV